MTRTAYDEYYGVGLDVAIASNYRLRLPEGENGVAYYCLRPSVPGLEVQLPVASIGSIPTLRIGQQLVVGNHGAHSLLVKDLLGTTIATVAAGTRQQLILLENISFTGTWITRNVASAIGTTLVHDRVSLDVIFGTWAGNGVNLRDYCNSVFGYDGSKPAAIYCELHGDIVIGSETTAEPAFDTGSWPDGSTLLLWIRPGGNQIVGRGGNGGHGQSWPASTNPGDGLAGGDALVIRLDTSLANNGTISGGGGGGGGGRAVSGVGGGAGAGGAGYQPSFGGNGGTPGGGVGTGGSIGVAGVPGNGGQNGGTGGGPGQDGNPATGGGVPNGGAGGARGAAIKRLSTATLTIIAAGTINGPQVVF